MPLPMNQHLFLTLILSDRPGNSDHSDTVGEHSRQLEAKMSPLVREIVESAPRTRQEFEFLYGRIVTSVILRSGKFCLG